MLHKLSVQSSNKRAAGRRRKTNDYTSAAAPGCLFVLLLELRRPEQKLKYDHAVCKQAKPSQQLHCNGIALELESEEVRLVMI